MITSTEGGLSVRGILFSGLELLSAGVFVLWRFCPFGFCPIGTFVHWGFSLTSHVIT